MRISLTLNTFLALAISGLCWLIAGASAGFFLGGLALLTILVPVCAMEDNLKGRLITAAFVIDGIALPWLISVFTSHVTFMQFLQCYVILIAYGATLIGIVSLTRRIASPTNAASIAVFVHFLWLTWPVWLAPWLRGQDRESLVGWLVFANPLLAINGVVKNLGFWLQQPLIYRHVTLGQDVAYSLPRSILPCVVMHLLIGAILILLSRMKLTTPPVPSLETGQTPT